MINCLWHLHDARVSHGISDHALPFARCTASGLKVIGSTLVNLAIAKEVALSSVGLYLRAPVNLTISPVGQYAQGSRLQLLACSNSTGSIIRAIAQKSLNWKVLHERRQNDASVHT